MCGRGINLRSASENLGARAADPHVLLASFFSRDGRLLEFDADEPADRDERGGQSPALTGLGDTDCLWRLQCAGLARERETTCPSDFYRGPDRFAALECVGSR